MSSRLLHSALTALLCLGAASASFASGPRLLALGGDGAYLEDAVNARVWYGSLADEGGWIAVESGVFEQVRGYPRDVWGEPASGPAAGAFVPLGKDGRHGTVGLWWNAHGADGGIGDLGDGLGRDHLYAAWQLQFAKDLGPLTGGFSIRHADVDRNVTDNLHRKGMRDDFGLGLRFDLSPRAYLDLAGEAVRLEDQSSFFNENDETRDTADNYGFRARAFVELDDGLVLVPVVESRREHRLWSARGDGDDRAHRLWRLGSGLTWLPDPDHLVLLACDWRENRFRASGNEREQVTDILAVRAAFEARLHALLTLRASVGYRHTGGFLTDDRDDVPLSLGLAVHAGPVDLDLAFANLPPATPSGLPEPWAPSDHSTWMNAGLSWWF